LTLTGRNTYTGSTTVNAGTLQAGAINAIPTTSSVSVANGATLDLNNFDQTMSSISGGGSLTLGRGTLTLNDNGSNAFSGVMSGSGGLTKIGPGLLSLTGNNTYSGATVVFAGILEVGSSSASGDVLSNSDVTIGPEGALQGSGRVKTITAAGNVSPTLAGPAAVTVPCPGDTTQSCTVANPFRGILAASKVVFNPGSSFGVRIAGLVAGTGYTQLRAAAAVSLVGSPILNIAVAFHPVVGDTFTLIDTPAGTSGIDGTFHGLPNGAMLTVNNVTLRINYDSRATLTVVPPPDANHRFVIQMYQDLLKRQPDANGLAFWADQLDHGTSRSQVVLVVEASQEYRTVLVQSLYQTYLHRAADPTGLTAFVSFLGAGGTDEQVQSMITGSQEYFQSHGSTNDGFLSAIYQDALNRAIDPTGRTAFMNALNNGSSRGDVASIIFGSPEYRQDLVRGFYQNFLRRAADIPGLNALVAALQSGARDEDVVASIISSPEYFGRL
jgi:autotransporter-associated beta strand protein